MPAASYCVLTHDARYLKGIGAAESTQPAGITAADLLQAERLAKDAIDGWLVGVARATRGAAIVAELTAAPQASVDPEIVNLADLKASAIIWEWYETRNFGNITQADAPTLKSTQLKEDAVAKASGIEEAGILIKADRTIRRLRYSGLEQGMVVGGPMSGGSHFDPSKQMTDVLGVTHQLPHVEPIEEAGF